MFSKFGSYRQKDPYEEIRQNIRHAVPWQIRENVWLDGSKVPADFEKVIGIIKEAGYRGYLPLETLGAGDPYQKIPHIPERVKRAIQSNH